MAKFLAIFNSTIDEIEINGFVMMTEKEVQAYEDSANNIGWGFSYPIGQDFLEFTCGEDLLSCIEFKELTSEESKIFKRTFNEGFGVFIPESFLLKVIGDEEDDYDDEDEDDDDYDDDDYDSKYYDDYDDYDND